MKKIRRIRVTTTTSRLIVALENKIAAPAAGATEDAAADGQSHPEICPTCGQRLLSAPAAAASIEPPLLPPSPACPNEHDDEKDRT